jgi:hypothetical protein
VPTLFLEIFYLVGKYTALSTTQEAHSNSAVLWSPEVGMEVVACSVRRSEQRGLGEPPLFPCVPVPSENTQLTYHPRVGILLHSTVEPGSGSGSCSGAPKSLVGGSWRQHPLEEFSDL